MIIVRVGLARDQSLSGSLGGSSAPRTRNSHGLQHTPDGFGATSIAVEITQFIESDGTSTPSESNMSPMQIELKTRSDTMTDTYTDAKA